MPVSRNSNICIWVRTLSHETLYREHRCFRWCRVLYPHLPEDDVQRRILALFLSRPGTFNDFARTQTYSSTA